MIKRLLPAPGLTLLLCVAWLLLNPTLSLGNLLLALLVGWGLPLLTLRWTRWSPGPLRWRAGRTAGRLFARVLRDIVHSNFSVARRVLGPPAALQARFIWLPLALRSPHAITVLASIITLTPGTVSCQLSADRRYLLVHALHCASDAQAAALVADIQTRYEQALLEIFECC